MSNPKRDVFSEAVVGLFMVVVVALLAYFTIVISGVDLLSGREKRRVTAEFSQVGGLKVHDAVMYRGTKVGTVSEVNVTPSNLVVVADVDANVTMRRSCRVTVCHLSMLGGNYLLLEEGEGEPIDLSSARLVGEAPSDWLRDIADISRNLKALTQMDELKTIVTNLSEVSERAVGFAEKATAVAEKAASIADKVDRFAGRADRFVDKADRFADSANEIIGRISRGEGTVGKLVSADCSVYDDIRASVASLRQATEGLDVKDTVARANALLVNLNALAERMKSGEGTLGRLANDPQLYDEVNGLIRDCRQIIDNYRDTTPIATFSSVLTGVL